MILTDGQKRSLNSTLGGEYGSLLDRQWEIAEVPDGENECLWNLLIDGRFVDTVTPKEAREVASM